MSILSKAPKLTQTVNKGGCAAKIAATELRAILNQVHFPPRPPELLVDSEFFDDAGVYQVHADLALVQTLDFFTPIVDDPYRFGQIAAANALSDVYAMGGLPKTAMGILAMPTEQLAPEVIVQVLQGASDKVGEAGACFVGGHSIDDDTLKFGLSVTGFVHPQRLWTNAAARPGDLLILTKALGTGTATAALKRGEVTEDDIADVLNSMAQLNRVPDLLGDSEKSAVRAATDITGFGLAGHGLQMALASRVILELDTDRLPLFPKTRSFLERGFFTKAHRSNERYVRDSAELAGLDDITKWILMDPQTSGGLLLAVDAARALQICQTLRLHFPHTAVVGRVREGREGPHLRFRSLE